MKVDNSANIGLEPLTITDEKQHHIATSFQTILKIVKVTLGSGIFAIPYAYSQAGLFYGILLQVLVYAAQFKSWCTLVSCIGEEKRLTLNKYLEITYGSTSVIYYLAQIMAILLNFGCAVSYIILFTTTIDQYLEENWLLRIIMFASLFIILFGASFAKSLQIFTPVLKASLILVYISFAYLSTLAIIEFRNWELVQPDAKKVMIAFGIMMFAYDINGVLTEIRVEMKDTTQFKKCLFIAMTSETLLYLIFGISSSLLFQSGTEQSIIGNFKDFYKGKEVIVITLSILMISYVSMLIINTMMVNLPVYLVVNTANTDATKMILKAIFVLCELLTAFLYPNFAFVLSIVGCVCCVTLGFIIPYGMTFNYALKLRYKVLNTIVVLFGIVGGVFGIIACF